MRHTLEGSKLFPYIAWITLLLFVLLTYSLVLELQKSVAGLGIKMDEKVEAIKNNPNGG